MFANVHVCLLASVNEVQRMFVVFCSHRSSICYILDLCLHGACVYVGIFRLRTYHLLHVCLLGQDVFFQQVHVAYRRPQHCVQELFK